MNIYHERQKGNWCAIHATNSLLQAHTFTFEDFKAIAESLDEREMVLMGSIRSKFHSQNMDDRGNFSIQVIMEAIAPCGLDLLPFLSSDPRAISARENSRNEQAFICNRNNHWFTFRKIGTTWYDLNSLLPQPLVIKVEGTQLHSFSNQELIRSYTAIFIVIGNVAQKQMFLVGDPGQLPPVAAPSLFSHSTQAFANEGFCAYRSFKKVITLKESCRQIVIPGDEPQLQFLQALNGIRGGTCSQGQWRFLCTRAPQRIANFQDNFKDSVHLDSTNEKMKEWNLKKLRDLKSR